MNILKGKKVAVIGGDTRQVELINGLISSGADVVCFATPQEGLKNSVELVTSLDEALSKIDALILPITGTEADGTLRFTTPDVKLTKEILGKLSPETPIFIGSVVPVLAEICEKLNLPVIEMAKDDELNILNSIPSAEGAVELAMSMTPFTIHHSNSAVLGFGRTASTLSRMLKGIGANVTVVARKSSDRARAFEMGFKALSFKSFDSEISSFDIIFNTVPSRVLDREHIKMMKPFSYIVDLATPPGGVDFEAAKEFGITAELALGLPGKVAPFTAGKILARIIPKRVAAALKKSK